MTKMAADDTFKISALESRFRKHEGSCFFSVILIHSGPCVDQFLLSHYKLIFEACFITLLGAIQKN